MSKIASGAWAGAKICGPATLQTRFSARPQPLRGILMEHETVDVKEAGS
jgi:hypothetical protein